MITTFTKCLAPRETGLTIDTIKTVVIFQDISKGLQTEHNYIVSNKPKTLDNSK